jgi:hypothetical protein
LMLCNSDFVMHSYTLLCTLFVLPRHTFKHTTIKIQYILYSLVISYIVFIKIQTDYTD